MTKTRQTASQQIRAVLVGKDYRCQARKYVEGGGQTYTWLEWYRKGERRYLLEIVANRDSREEVGCHLWVDGTQGHSTAYVLSTIL